VAIQGSHLSNAAHYLRMKPKLRKPSKLDLALRRRGLLLPRDSWRKSKAARIMAAVNAEGRE